MENKSNEYMLNAVILFFLSTMIIIILVISVTYLFVYIVVIGFFISPLKFSFSSFFVPDLLLYQWRAFDSAHISNYVLIGEIELISCLIATDNG